MKATVLMFFAVVMVVEATPTPTPAIKLSAPIFFLVWDDPNPASAGVTSYQIYEQVGKTYNLLTTVKPPTKTWQLPSSLTSSPHTFIVRGVSIRGPGKIASTSYATLPAIPDGISNMRIEVKARLQ